MSRAIVAVRYRFALTSLKGSPRRAGEVDSLAWERSVAFLGRTLR